MKKEFNSLKDFLEDPSFNRWVRDNREPDEAFWKDWLKEHPEKQEVVAAATLIIKGISFNPNYPSDAIIKEELNLLHTTISEKKLEKGATTFSRPLLRKRNWAIAASFALLLTLGFLISFFLNNSMVKHQTAYGEINKINLPDGTAVSLNANSNLKYHPHNPRKVWLDGEAFFEVTQKLATHENFQVLTKDLTVKVLGTIFNVNSRNNKTKVFLEEGKVLLEVKELKKDEIEMVPGELVSYSKKQHKVLEKKQSNAIHHTSWKDGIIRFKDAPLATTLKEISDIYGIIFEINQEESDEEQLFSGGIPVENLAITLAILKEVYGLEMEQIGDKYIIGK